MSTCTSFTNCGFTSIHRSAQLGALASTMLVSQSGAHLIHPLDGPHHLVPAQEATTNGMQHPGGDAHHPPQESYDDCDATY